MNSRNSLVQSRLFKLQETVAVANQGATNEKKQPLPPSYEDVEREHFGQMKPGLCLAMIYFPDCHGKVIPSQCLTCPFLSKIKQKFVKYYLMWCYSAILRYEILLKYNATLLL